MWTIPQLIDDLRDIGLSAGDTVLVHTSLRAVGAIDGGALSLIKAFRTVLDKTGTLVAPTFTLFCADGGYLGHMGESGNHTLANGGDVTCFDAVTTPAEVAVVGNFAEQLRLQGDALRSAHPLVSFAAIGANALYLTENAPFHYPLGSDSLVARLHQLDGKVLLMGVDHSANVALHLAEVWADVPYIHRSVDVRIGSQEWTRMHGSPVCNQGFPKIEPLLRQSRLLRCGYIGNAASQLMRIRQVVSMAISVLQGNAAALLCNRADCSHCALARKFTVQQETLPDGGVVEF